MRWMTYLFITLVLSVSHVARSDDQDDREALQGTWLASAVEFGGRPFPDEIRKSISLTIDSGKYTVMVGKVADQGTVTLVPSAKPKTMDIIGTEGPNKGKTFLAIYERNGDTLKICYDLSGKNRPSEFKTAEGSQLFLVAYQRDKR